MMAGLIAPSQTMTTVSVLARSAIGHPDVVHPPTTLLATAHQRAAELEHLVVDHAAPGKSGDLDEQPLEHHSRVDQKEPVAEVDVVPVHVDPDDAGSGRVGEGNPLALRVAVELLPAHQLQRTRDLASGEGATDPILAPPSRHRREPNSSPAMMRRVPVPDSI